MSMCTTRRRAWSWCRPARHEPANPAYSWCVRSLRFLGSRACSVATFCVPVRSSRPWTAAPTNSLLQICPKHVFPTSSSIRQQLYIRWRQTPLKQSNIRTEARILTELPKLCRWIGQWAINKTLKQLIELAKAADWTCHITANTHQKHASVQPLRRKQYCRRSRLYYRWSRYGFTDRSC
jgi:hypothetical protein